MKLTGNTILITGGGSGIGRALAEAFHQRGNTVIIAGRRRATLEEVVAAHPGMEAIELDITDPGSIDAAAATLIADTNLLGPIRMTSALVEHLKGKQDAVIAYTSSVLGFVPMAVTAVYSATKAAIHSYALSQRFLLKDAGVRVIEIAPPWVRTDLMNSREAEQAMPLEEFIAQAMSLLGTDAEEIVVDGARAFRDNAGPHEHALVEGFNQQAFALFGHL